MAGEGSGALLGAAMEAVGNQLSENDPPETAQTLERLMEEGYSREDALALIARAMAIEIYEVVKTGLSYNQERYLGALNSLPELPE
jgi:hypothetical protein